MQSNFATKCKEAVVAAKVPPVPMAAIRDAARTRSTAKGSRRVTLFYSALFVAASGLTVAFGAQVFNRAYVYFGGSNGPRVVTQTLSVSWRATPAELRSALAQASYRVVVPSGLPKGTRLIQLGNIGRDIMIFWYRYPRAARPGYGTASIMVAPPDMVSVSRKALQKGVTLKNKGADAEIHWSIGREEVLLLRNTLSPAEISHVRETMSKQPCVLPSQTGHNMAIPSKLLQGCSYQFGAPAIHPSASQRERGRAR